MSVNLQGKKGYPKILTKTFFKICLLHSLSKVYLTASDLILSIQEHFCAFSGF